jgi:hypothetical protein
MPNDRGCFLDAEATEPAIGEVELDLAAQRAFRADGEHVADDEHPNHQHRIDRRSSGMGIVRRQPGPNPRQIKNASNGAHQVIVRNHRFEVERIEQLPLILAYPPHHHAAPPTFVSVRQNHCSQATSNDFCNKIGQ